MAKRWFNSLDFEVDDNGRPTFESALMALAGLNPALEWLAPVAIDDSAASHRVVLVAKDAAKAVRLHELILTLDVADDITVAQDDGPGVSQATLAKYHLPATSGVVVPFRLFAPGCIKAAKGRNLVLLSTASKMAGHAICSRASE